MYLMWESKIKEQLIGKQYRDPGYLCKSENMKRNSMLPKRKLGGHYALLMRYDKHHDAATYY